MFECGQAHFAEGVVNIGRLIWGAALVWTIKRPLMFPKKLIDDFIFVNEAEIINGIQRAYWQERQIIEGFGAVCTAALMAQKVEQNGPTIACITVGNIYLASHHRFILGENIEIENL